MFYPHQNYWIPEYLKPLFMGRRSVYGQAVPCSKRNAEMFENSAPKTWQRVSEVVSLHMSISFSPLERGRGVLDYIYVVWKLEDALGKTEFVQRCVDSF